MNNVQLVAKQRAILVDFDDTVLRTTGYKDLSYEFWSKHSSVETKARLNQYFQDYNDGKFTAFRPQDYLTNEEWLETLRFIGESVPNLLYRDAVDFLSTVHDGSKLYILTFGDKDFQEAKVVAAKLDIPAIYTDKKRKTDVIEQWWSDGRYEINGDVFSEVLLIDDRAHSFDNFERLQNARGILLRRPEAKLGENDNINGLPDNVSILKSFDEILL